MILKTLLSFASFSTLIFAASPAIGIVTASGHFTLDRSQVWGNATVFDGSVIETSSASSEIALRNGAKLQLAKDSRARLLTDRVVIEKGTGLVSGPPSFEVNAANLKIHTDGRLRIDLASGVHVAAVHVAALIGVARVSSANGTLLAAIPAGRAMDFPPQAESGTVTRTGCLLYKDNHYIMQDDNTQEVIELSGGQGLQAQLGNRVEITGTTSTTHPSVSIATLLLNVASMTPKSSGGCLSAASTLGAQTEAPANTTATAATQAPKGGMSTGAKVAIIVAIAGGGAGAAIALAGHKSSTSP